MKNKIEKAKYAIVYLTYGSDSFKYQAIISIYTLLHHTGGKSDDFLFVLYTDSKRGILDKYLNGLSVKIEVLSSQQINEFKGPQGYVLRMKPFVIKDFFSKYNNDLLFIDTDTFFLRNPTKLLQRISPGYSLMNAEEYNFVDAGAGEPDHWFTIRKALKRRSYTIRGEQLAIPLATVMWNSGIIGLSPMDAKLAEQIIELTDELYQQSKTFIAEQFATSYILQTATQLYSTEDYIEHYWRKEIKGSFNVHIPAFLKEHAGKSGLELYASAFDFAQRTNKIATPYRESLSARLRLRLKLIMQVARYGHLE